MSKESNAILGAYHLGLNDKIEGKPCKNPFGKQKDRWKHKAYQNGYNDGVTRKDL